jgi:hypothetical protein
LQVHFQENEACHIPDHFLHAGHIVSLHHDPEEKRPVRLIDDPEFTDLKLFLFFIAAPAEFSLLGGSDEPESFPLRRPFNFSGVCSVQVVKSAFTTRQSFLELTLSCCPVQPVAFLSIYIILSAGPKG